MNSGSPWRALLGLERNTTSHAEKLLSALGAFVGILVLWWLSAQVLSEPASRTLVVASMGASAVLLFAVPHGALSQPWPVLGGNVLSALIGVTCARLIPAPLLAGATAVGLAVGLMYYLRCLHPPGGATALTAVIGGPDVQALGYDYVFLPVLGNVLCILLVAFLFNYAFSWRRYPAALGKRHAPSALPAPALQDVELTQEDFAAAMQQLDSYVDITVDGLTELLELARENAARDTLHPAQILAGRCYSNGRLGRQWSVRQIIDAAEGAPAGKDQVIYKVLAGDGAWETGLCLRSEFRHWARFEVVQERGHWVKVQEQP
jgi:CBS domain-containing membrane protein